jgi:hypothetical protein
MIRTAVYAALALVCLATGVEARRQGKTWTDSGALPPPCGVRAERQDASRHIQFGSHIWLTI